ncbi:MAG: hypothetical protein KGN97_06005 [Bacteroidota bacterium]|nr:hypothetical protein [Bacteroidota bacterium]
MEVHHAHHPAHKKKWSEYLLEFFMLFFAVTLGFFAENVREHQVVVERKNQNLLAMVQDLKRDSAKLQDRIIEYTKAVKTFEDLKYASYQYHNQQMSEADYIDYVSNKYDSLNVGDSFFSNNSAYKNTIATGSLSVIESLRIKQLIAEYYEELSVKLSDNNRNLDDDLSEYVRSDMQIGNSINSEVRKSFAKLSHQQVLEDNKKNPAFTAAILSPTFSIHTNKFELRCDYYLYLMNRFLQVNQALLKELQQEKE